MNLKKFFERSWNTSEVGRFQAFSSPFFSDEKKGFRDLLVKFVVFVGLLALMQVLTSLLAGMARVPREFKPFSFLQAQGTTLVIILGGWIHKSTLRASV
ncbi:MAG: hypothetical protein U9Q92_07170 [archaeon]|nr:hypothetical protein [archaeon]